MRPAIAIFAFNRPASLKRLLDSLATCPEFDLADVTVFVDGPRSQPEATIVMETLKVAQDASRPSWRIVASPTNQGLRRSIFLGVSDVCDRFGHAIVLEDDLIVAPAALAYFMEALQKYQNDNRVWSICGYAYETEPLRRSNRAFFIPFAHPWGWATWARAWKLFEYEQPVLPNGMLKSRHFKRCFDAGGLSEATQLLDLAQRGLVDSWFIRWHQQIFRNGGLSLFPSRHYVVNRGVARGGTHASALNPYRLLVGSPIAENAQLPQWPESVETDFLALEMMAKGRDARAQRFIAIAGRFKRLYFKRRPKT